MRVIYTVIFGNYEELKNPLVITPGWRYLCFTDQPLQSNIWEIVNVDTWEDKRMHSREYKINFYRYIEEQESIYIDGSFTVNCDLNQWWRKFKPPATFISHPRRSCVFEEINTCILRKRCDPEKLIAQANAYRFNVKRNTGLIQSGLMMRRKEDSVITLMRRWWEELQKYSTRDQIAMAYVARKRRINTIQWNYAKATEFIYKTHYCRRNDTNGLNQLHHKEAGV